VELVVEIVEVVETVVEDVEEVVELVELVVDVVEEVDDVVDDVPQTLLSRNKPSSKHSALLDAGARGRADDPDCSTG
jgi:hypothetical protein